MRLHALFTAAAVVLSLAAGSAAAQTEKAKKQAEIRKATAASLEKFYKADPKLKEAFAKAPGYAVFTTQALYDEAKKKGWIVISRKDDWKKIFAFE
jgi:hypothetical protein